MNRITSNPEYKDSFIHWALDHYKHFQCWPGSFIYPISEDSDIEFSETEVWDALKEIFPNSCR